MHSGDERGARSRTNPGGREGPRVANAPGRKGVEVGRSRIRIAVATQVRAYVFGDEKEKAGTFFFFGVKSAGEQQNRDDHTLLNEGLNPVESLTQKARTKRAKWWHGFAIRLRSP